MLGIDVSQKTLVCSLVEPQTRKLERAFEVPNAPLGWKQLIEQVPASTPWVLEPTGRYSIGVAKAGIDAGRQVLLAPSKAAKHFLASRQTRAKTDRIDSRGLAEFGLSAALRPYPLKTPAVERLSQLLTVRRSLSATLSRFHQQARELPEAAEHLATVTQTLEAQLTQLDKQIGKLTADKEQYPHVRRLDQVPGIGPVVAAAVALCLQSKQFTHPDQFVAYVGLDLAVRQSGKRSGTLGLTKQGPGELRRLLYLAAQANLRCKKSPFKDQYERERAKGLATTAALCAVARKLARVCWSIAKHGTDYRPERVNQQERPAPKSDPPATSN
jgi:transposase